MTPKMQSSLAVVVVMMFVLVNSGKAEDGSAASLGKPAANILTRENRENFSFTAWPGTHVVGNPINVADEHSRITPAQIEKYMYQTRHGDHEIAYIMVDLKRQYFIKAFAVSGHPDGSHKPRDEWYLEGSNDATIWKMVGFADASKWLAPGTYPFRESQIVKCMYPAKYRYYRIIARRWSNGYMIVNNWGLFA